MDIQHRLTTKELLARWRALETGEIAIDVDWYELDERGDIIVTPRPTTRHQAIAGFIAFQLADQLGALAAQGVPVVTSAGIRVPDVVWMPVERWREALRDDPLPSAPDLCVEVLSPWNHPLVISMKLDAYLASGAKEVIVVGLNGDVRFWRQDGESLTSSLGISLATDLSKWSSH